MCTKVRFMIQGQELGAQELEIEAAVHQGKVCISFKCLTFGHQAIAGQLRQMLHEPNDLSIAQKDDVHTMNTRHSDVESLINFLRRMGYKCRELTAH